MTWKRIKQQTTYYFQYFPITLNGIICLALAITAYKILYQTPTNNELNPSAYTPFIYLMGKLVLGVAVAILLISLFSLLISYLYFLYLRSKKKTNLQIHFSNVTKGNRTLFYIHALLPGAWRPILGFIKVRLLYDDDKLTDKFNLQTNQYTKGSYKREAISAKSQLELPDIKEYELTRSFIYFEDLLQLFSLACTQKMNGQFHQPPNIQKLESEEIAPKKTETLDVRIEQMKRVEGDPLSYKDFEAGDDVRRIVWKVYAKNKDLVVRVPELFEPYASHLYYYASFYADSKPSWWNADYQSALLNYYKNAVWTVYDALSKKEWALRYIPDQDFILPEQLNDVEKAERIISNSEWQTDKTLNEYFNAKQGAALCISSFTDPSDLEKKLAQCDQATLIYFVKCSKVFHHFIAWGWVKRILFIPPKDKLSRLRSGWLFSPQRIDIHKREKRIETILKQSGIKYGIL